MGCLYRSIHIMTYLHKGRILKNGIVEPGSIIEDAEILSVRPEDDGLHIVDFQKGDFEWWYFDVMDRETSCFIKMVIHIGTDPLRSRIFPQLAVSVNTPERSDAIAQDYSLGELRADTRTCDLSLGNGIQVRADPSDQSVYYIRIDVRDFRCSFRFTGSIEGWKPLGNEIIQQMGRKTSAFSWVIPIPRGLVDGEFEFGGKSYEIKHAVGYHDHNYVRMAKRRPLYLDDLITRWYWGKGYAGDHSVIFMDTHCRTNRIRSLMVSDGHRIVYSANNAVESTVVSYGSDPELNINYPEQIRVRSTDAAFQFQADFVCDRISDRKDLLEGIHPLARFLIRALVAKPAYHGILSGVRLKTDGPWMEGYGNFESMVFRAK